MSESMTLTEVDLDKWAWEFIRGLTVSNCGKFDVWLRTPSRTAIPGCIEFVVTRKQDGFARSFHVEKGLNASFASSRAWAAVASMPAPVYKETP